MVMFSFRETRANQLIFSSVPVQSSSPSGCSGYSRSLSPSSSVQQDVSLESNISAPFSMESGSPHKLFSLRGRNMKEYEEHLNSLKNENFTLKLRVYFLEERLGNMELTEDKEQLYRTNMELKVETEALKKELLDKQDLVQQASVYLTSLEEQYKEQIQKLQEENSKQRDNLYERITILEKQSCEPEIEVRVKEIMEKDRIIEEKMEQLEQQNKILVEIQITLEEQQKHNAELEASLTEVKKIVDEKSKQLILSNETIKELAEKLMTVEKESGKLKKELSRKEKKLRDLTSEHKETLDMLQQSQFQDQLNTRGVKQMEQDEHEGLWAGIEQKKLEVASLNKRLAELSSEVTDLRKRAEKAENLLEETKKQKNLTIHDSISVGNNLKESNLQNDQIHKVILLEQALQRSREDLEEKKLEIKELKGDVKKQADLLQNLFTQELMGKNIELKKLHKKFMNDQPNNNADLFKELLNGLNTHHENRIALKQRREENKESESHKDNSDKSSGFSALENALFAHMGQKVYNTTQTFNTYVTPSSNDEDQDVCQEDREENQEKSESDVAKLLIEEVASIKRETEALRQEKGNSSENGMKCRVDNVQALTQKLHESLEEKHLKDQEHQQIVYNFQEKIKELKCELQNSKKHITMQVVDMASKKYRESMEKYKEEICSLRKRLAESHNACDLLRTRLEELVDFIEQILEMEKKGIINLSTLSQNKRASIRQTLNDSRALSHSLSQSLMIGMESHLGDTLADESRFSIMLDTIPQDIDLTRDGNETGVLFENTLDISKADATAKNFIYENIEEKLESFYDLKMQSIDEITEKFNQLISIIQLKEKEIRVRDEKINDLSTQVDFQYDTTSANSSKANRICEAKTEIEFFNSESESSKTSRGSSPIKFGKTDQEKQIEQSEIIIKGLEKEKTDQEHIIGNQKIQIDELSEHLAQLKANLESKTCTDKVIGNLCEALKTAESRILKINQEKLSLDSEVSQLKGQLNTANSHVSSMEINHINTSCVSPHSEKCCKKIIESCRSSQSSLQLLELQNKQLILDKNLLAERVDSLQLEVSSLMEKLSEASSYSKEYEEFKVLHEELHHQFKSLRFEYESVLSEKDDIQKNFDEMASHAMRCIEKVKHTDKLFKESTKLLAIERSLTMELRKEINDMKSTSKLDGKRRNFYLWYELYHADNENSPSPSSPSSRRNFDIFHEIEELEKDVNDENKENVFESKLYNSDFIQERYKSPSKKGSSSLSLRSSIPVCQQSNIRSSGLCSDPSHSKLSLENEKLRKFKDDLTGELFSTKNVLKETQEELNSIKDRKQSIERAMYREVEKTNQVLKRVKKNMSKKMQNPST